MNTTYTIPFPPSVNEAYRAIRRGDRATNIKSKKWREYPLLVKAAIGSIHPDHMILGRAALSIILHEPSHKRDGTKDGTRRDLDNFTKSIQDALTLAGVWKDDSPVDILIIERGKKFSGGRAVVSRSPG